MRRVPLILISAIAMSLVGCGPDPGSGQGVIAQGISAEPAWHVQRPVGIDGAFVVAEERTYAHQVDLWNAAVAANEAAQVQQHPTPSLRHHPAPTAPPRPVSSPPAVDLGPSGSTEEAIYAVFGDEGANAVAVARCESGMDPGRTGSAGERGIFQIHPTHRHWVESMGYSWDQMYEVGPNLQVAFALWSGAGWGPWSCRRVL